MECRNCSEETREHETELCPECLDEHLTEIGEAGEALAQFLEIPVSDVEIDEGYRTEYNAEGATYLVLTDQEANDAAKAAVESYVEECVLGDIPKPYHYYFDTEHFVADVLRHDGRGMQLAPYDGAENEANVNDTWYFIYLQS